MDWIKTVVLLVFHQLGFDIVEVFAQGKVTNWAVFGQPHKQGDQIHIQTWVRAQKHKLNISIKYLNEEYPLKKRLSASLLLSEISRLEIFGISAMQPSRTWEPPERSWQQRTKTSQCFYLLAFTFSFKILNRWSDVTAGLPRSSWDPETRHSGWGCSRGLTTTPCRHEIHKKCHYTALRNVRTKMWFLT